HNNQITPSLQGKRAEKLALACSPGSYRLILQFDFCIELSNPLVQRTNDGCISFISTILERGFSGFGLDEEIENFHPRCTKLELFCLKDIEEENAD
ncbi:MAG: hypothetical protein ACE5DO_14530, partial [Desulfobacterales bacterium]